MDYQRGAALSSTTVVLVWTVYLGHFALDLFAAFQRYYPIACAEIIFILLGVLLALAGTTLYVLGILHFKSIHRMSGVDTSELITDGIYAWSRNPQNVGWILFLFGIGFIARSGSALLLALVFTLIFIVYVPMEERHLESLYGDSYREYKKKPPRFIGPPMERDSG